MERLEWNAGDRLEVYRHAGDAGKGLTYASGEVVAGEPGFSGGWDVYDGIAADGTETSFYGFSVRAVLTCRSIHESGYCGRPASRKPDGYALCPECRGRWSRLSASTPEGV